MDFSIDIPADLWKGLLYSVAVATWRDGLREAPGLAAKLKGFRPDRVPLKELDRVVLKALDEEPLARDFAIERFAAENAGLLSALGTLGPAGAAAPEALERLLRDESAARVFWAAFRGGDTWAGVRDAVLKRVREGKLDGAALFPPRLDRRPKAPPPAEAAAACVAAPAPVVVAVEIEQITRLEREVRRAREDNDRLREEVRRLEETEGRLLAARERLERELEDARRAAAAAHAEEAGRRPPPERRALEHEVERLRAEIVAERKITAEATQRSRTLKHELDEARARLAFFEAIDLKVTYPRQPAGVSARSEAEKVVWPSDEHHWPKRLRPFVERLARSPWVDRIHLRDFEASSDTRVKGVDERGNILLLYSDGLKAVRLYLTTVAKDEHEGRWIADRLGELEPSLKSPS